MNSNNLREILETKYTVGDLKKYRDFLKIQSSNIKMVLVEEVSKSILKNVQIIYDSLSEPFKIAVQETIYNYNNLFNSEKFNYKYKNKPEIFKEEILQISKSRSYWFEKKTLSYELIFFELVIPNDISEILKTFVTRPTSFTLKSYPIVPDFKEIEKEDDSLNLEDKKLMIRETENDSLKNIKLILTLIQSAKIKGSDKTNNVSDFSLELISKLLHNGEFYNLIKNFYFISYSIPHILVNAKIAKYEGSKLVLTSIGQKILNQKGEEILKECFQKWQSSKFDEFSRIDIIKGQKNGLARNVATRRTAILKSLTKLPINEWVSISELSKFMIVSNNKFDVSSNDFELYIEDRQYGNFGYQGYASWEILEERYILVYLFEYLAPLGIIDIAYVDPVFTRMNSIDQWGTDDLDYISRYDGLLYFKINLLGKYILGLTDKYIPSEIKLEKSVKVLANLEIVITKEISNQDKIFLENFCKKINDKIYKLDEPLLLNFLENGEELNQILNFLETISEVDLPNTVIDFFDRIKRKSGLFKNLGYGKILEVEDKATALLIINDKELKGKLFFSEPNRIIVPSLV